MFKVKTKSKIKKLSKVAVLSTLAVTGLAACDQSTTAPEPEPQVTSAWDMDVIIRYVQASAERTCDGTTILGNNNPGEYQYRIDASDGQVSERWGSPGYGAVDGTSYTLDRSERRDFANQTWRFLGLKEGEAVSLTLRSIEWDGPRWDDYMKNRSNVLTLRPSTLLPNGGKKTDRALGVGKATCGLTLYYDVVVKHREVPVG